MKKINADKINKIIQERSFKRVSTKYGGGMTGPNYQVFDYIKLRDILIEEGVIKKEKVILPKNDSPQR